MLQPLLHKVSFRLLFKIWLAIATAIFSVILIGLYFEVEDESRNQIELINNKANLISERVNGSFMLYHELIEKFAQSIRYTAPKVNNQAEFASKLPQWQHKENNEHLEQIKMRILYVGNQTEYFTDIPQPSHILAKETLDLFHQWIAAFSPNEHAFDWHIRFSVTPYIVYVCTVFQQQATDSTPYFVVACFELEVQEKSIFNAAEKLFVINKQHFAMSLETGSLLPTRLYFEELPKINNDTQAITNFHKIKPDTEFQIIKSAKENAELYQVNQDDKAYYIRKRTIANTGWTLLLLLDSAAALEAVDDEIQEAYGTAIFSFFMLLAFSSIFYYTRKVKTLTYIDPLTRLFNRNHFKDNVGAIVNLHDRKKIASLGFVTIDIDHFKQVNDKHGHIIGDRVLKVLAKLLRDELRDSDLVYRMGGEEFLIVFQGEPLPKLIEIAERLRKSVEQQSSTCSYLPEGFTISLGVHCHKQGESLAKAITQADNLLYKAKENGRNQVQS